MFMAAKISIESLLGSWLWLSLPIYLPHRDTPVNRSFYPMHKHFQGINGF